MTIDDRRITACEGRKLRSAASGDDSYIPNLFALRVKPEAACRLRFVEVMAKEQPVTACTEKVAEGMLVNTKGNKALRLQRSAFGLLMFSHPRALVPAVPVTALG